VSRPLPEELLLPRGHAEALLVALVEGCEFLSSRNALGGGKSFQMDLHLVLTDEWAAKLDLFIDYAREQRK
jgi:hypothetical protein